ncbi:caspase family protein [Catenuloplanes sp. NPDC051500]|uniref:caspase, EACC1-associated type n=1 Tax=Catenuloplanes sp. NPDC051500 TaxID=3363959 RepID=UPI00378B90A4
MRVPQRDRSNLVIVGTSRYDDKELHDLPGVRNNVRDLWTLLTDPADGIVADDRCTVVLDQAGPRPALQAVREHAEAATDTLVVYFAGHGLLSDDGRLHLAMRDTSTTDVAVSGLAFERFHEAVYQNSARNTVVILDCCYSGRAVNGSIDGDSYLITSTPSNRPAVAPLGWTHTAFSGELIKLLRDGIRDGPKMLSVQFLFERLRSAMQAGGFPAPANRMTGTATGVVLSRNRWPGSAGTPAPAAAREAVPAPVPTQDPRPSAGTKPAAGSSAGARPAALSSADAKPGAAAPPRGDRPATAAARTSPAVRTSTVTAAGNLLRAPAAHLVPAEVRAPAARYTPLPRPIFCPDGETLVVGGRGGRMEIWDVAARRLRHTVAEGVAHYAVGVGGTTLATAERDHTIGVWTIRTGRRIARLDTAGRWLALHPTVPLLVSVGREQDAEIWDVRTRRRVHLLRGHDGDILRGGFSPDGGRVITTGRDRTLRLWDARSGRQLTVLSGAHSPRQVALHTGAGWAATTLASGGVRLRSLDTGEKLADLRDESIPSEVLAGRDGRTLATLTAGGRVRVFDIRSGRTVLDRQDEPVSRILYGPGSSLATMTNDGVVRVRDFRTGRVRHTLRDGLRAPCWLTFDQGGDRAALGRRDRTVHLFDLRSGGGPQPLPAVARPTGPPPGDRGDDFLRSVYERLRTTS